MVRYESIPVTGVIESVQQRTGETADTDISITYFPRAGNAPSSKIRYTILCNDPRSGIIRIEGVQPLHNRWDDSINIQPAKPGTGVTGIIQVFGGASTIQWTIIEMPGVRDCREVGVG